MGSGRFTRWVCLGLLAGILGLPLVACPAITGDLFLAILTFGVSALFGTFAGAGGAGGILIDPTVVSAVAVEGDITLTSTSTAFVSRYLFLGGEPSQGASSTLTFASVVQGSGTLAIEARLMHADGSSETTDEGDGESIRLNVVQALAGGSPASTASGLVTITGAGVSSTLPFLITFDFHSAFLGTDLAAKAGDIIEISVSCTSGTASLLTGQGLTQVDVEVDIVDQKLSVLLDGQDLRQGTNNVSPATVFVQGGLSRSYDLQGLFARSFSNANFLTSLNGGSFAASTAPLEVFYGYPTAGWTGTFRTNAPADLQLTLFLNGSTLSSTVVIPASTTSQTVAFPFPAGSPELHERRFVSTTTQLVPFSFVAQILTSTTDVQLLDSRINPPAPRVQATFSGLNDRITISMPAR